MQVHIIDHNSVHIPLIAKLVAESFPSLTTLTFAKTHAEHEQFVTQSDLVIVSGGTWLTHLNPTTHRKLTQQLVAMGKPIFGICLGAEALAWSFGAELVQLPGRIEGDVDISLDDATFYPQRTTRTMRVYEYHRWAIRALPPELKMVAHSAEGVELFKHQTLPIWGSQFHPEVRRHDNHGNKIFAAVMQEFGLHIKAGLL